MGHNPDNDVPPDPMASVTAPPAVAPIRSTTAGMAQLGNDGMPAIHQHGTQLANCQTIARQLQDVCARGRRLTHRLTTSLHRADDSGVSAVLEEIRALETPAAIIGPENWSNLERRVQLFDTGGVPSFVENLSTALAFRSFLSSGVLAPQLPPEWTLGVCNRDDEFYMLGVIGGAREIERFAVSRGRKLDLDSIRVCLGAVQAVEQALLQFDFRNSDLRRRFDGVKYYVKKMENFAYEVDLAIQRSLEMAAASAPIPYGGGVSTGFAAAGGGADAARMAVDTPSSAIDSGTPRACIDLAKFSKLKENYDIFDKMREDVIKRSRDVTKTAKNAIYSLQRGDTERADADLQKASRLARGIHREFVYGVPSLRFGGFSASLEELAEALAYREFRRSWRVLGMQELQDASGLDFPVTLAEYLGGLMDLTGEVGRFAVRSASRGRDATPDVERCWACVDGIYRGMQDLPYLPQALSKKMGPLAGTLGKIETILYELALLTRGGLRASAASVDFDIPEDDGAGYTSCQAALDAGD